LTPSMGAEHGPQGRYDPPKLGFTTTSKTIMYTMGIFILDYT
jgi:hypothetical protein